MALVQKQFGDLITFTRSSAGGRFNESGLFEMVPANQPRFDYDPVTKLPLGLLIEGSRTNLVTNSTDLTKWMGRQISLTQADVSSPDGGRNAALAIANTSEAWHQILSPTFPVAQGLTYTASVYVKTAGKLTARLTIENATLFPTSNYGRFNILDGTVLSGAGATISSVGAGWFRISVVSTALVTGTTLIALGVGDTGVVGNDQDGVMYWGAQVEAGSFATSYIPTTNSQVTRSADVANVNTLSPWFNQAEGSFVVELKHIPAALAPANRHILGLQLNESNWFAIRSTAAHNVEAKGSNTFGVTNIDVARPAVANGSLFRCALGYKTGDVTLSTNGSSTKQAGQISFPFPTPESNVARMAIGHFTSGSLSAFAYIRSIRYYARRLADAELEAFTK